LSAHVAGLTLPSFERYLAMTQVPTLNIARPVLMLTDHHAGDSFLSLSALSFSQGVLNAVIGSGSPAAPRGVSLALPNLLSLLDANPGTGVPPVFSLQLTELPRVQSGGWSAVFTFGAKPQFLTSPIDGVVPVNFVVEPDTQGLRIEVASNTRLRMTSPTIQIDLPAGATVGRTRVDAAGAAWLDLNFLSLISSVTEGAALLTSLMGVEAPAEFFIDFGSPLFALQGQPITRLSATVLLDKTPNFAPLMPASGVVSTAIDGLAGVAFNVGRPWFFGADYSLENPMQGFDVRDPSLNFPAGASSDSKFTALADWIRDVRRPVLVAEPNLGRLEFEGGQPISFPEQIGSLPSLDTLGRSAPSDSINEADFVSFGGRAFRALSLDEVSKLQYRAYSTETLLNPNPTLHFMARDAAGGLSGEMIVRTVISTAKVSCEVLYWSGGQPVPGVSMSLESILTDAAVQPLGWTDANGIAVHQGLDFSRYALRVNRIANHVEVSASVDAADVLAALRLAHGRSKGLASASTNGETLGLATSRYSKAAADADGDGHVSSADVALVLDIALGKAPSTAGGRFFGVDGALPAAVEADSSGQVMLTAVLTGDVDGSWGRWLGASLDPGV